MTDGLPEALSTRQLNRALLARQHLLERTDAPMTRVIEDIGGLQTQYAPSGYVSLWSRMRSFERPSLTRALEQREVIQGTLMRVTIHTVSASDYWPIVAGVRDSRRDWFERVTARTRGDLDLPGAAEATRHILAAGPLRITELNARLAERGFADLPAGALNVWVDLVRIPPSGTWERRRADLYGLAEQWLPVERKPTPDEGLRLLVRRYLEGFGPARTADIADWAGVPVTSIAAAAAQLDVRLFRDERGRELIDLPGLPLPPADTPAPVRFLAPFDPTLLTNCRRTGILPEEFRPRLASIGAQWSNGAILVDGRVAGMWRHEAARVRTVAFVPLDAVEQRAVDEEADALTVLFAG